MLMHTKGIGTVMYVSGSRQTLSIPRDGVLTMLSIKLGFTVTNGSSAAVGALWEALARLLQRVEVVINGKDTIVNMDGPGLVARAIYEFGNRPFGTGSTVVLTGSAATAYEIVVPIPFFLPRSNAPYRCALPCSRFNDVTLGITWGPSDCSDFYTTPNSAAISAVACEVDAEYMVGADVEGVNYNARVLYHDTPEITASSTGLQYRLDTGTGLLWRSLMAVATVGHIANASVVNELTLQSGTFIFQKRDATLLKATNQHKFNQSSPQTGVFFLMTEVGGSSANWINTDRAVMKSDLVLVADVTKQTGTNHLRQYYEVIRPFNLAAAA